MRQYIFKNKIIFFICTYYWKLNLLFYFRVNRLERDTNQKRTLLEEQRSKLKQVQSSAKTDANAVVSTFYYH
jgi:hypothetical protein